MVVQVLTDFQMMQSISRALRETQKQLAEAQVQMADAVSTVAIFEERFNFGEYTRKSVNDMTLTVSHPVADLDTSVRIGSQMQPYMEEVIKVDKAKKEWAEKIKCKCGSAHGRISNMDKPSDYV